MSPVQRRQHDIRQTLRQLLPVQGTPKTLKEIRDQVRLLNEIRDPSDERLARIIARYFRDPKYNQDTRFLKIDRFLSDEDLFARWTRVRVGPSVWEPPPIAKGTLPNQKLIEEKLPIIWDHVHGLQTSFYLWDLLREHFEVTRDDNRYYRQWLEALSDALKRDPRFVIVAVDVETNIPVEWMLAIDRERQVNEDVRNKVDDLIAFMQRDSRLIHLTRDLVHSFFAPDVVDETYDIHTYFKAVSRVLMDNPSVAPLSLQEGPRRAEAWCLRERVQQIIQGQLVPLLNWLRTIGTPQSLDAISHQNFKSLPELVSTDVFVRELESALRQDNRFIPDYQENTWTAVPPGDHSNNLVYIILYQERHPLTRQQIVEQAKNRPLSQSLAFQLDTDLRFKQMTDGRWMLARWMLINDLAASYLAQSPIPLLADTIRRKVCETHNINVADAIFEPEGDPRFVRDPLGKWTCQDTVGILGGKVRETADL